MLTKWLQKVQNTINAFIKIGFNVNEQIIDLNCHFDLLLKIMSSIHNDERVVFYFVKQFKRNKSNEHWNRLIVFSRIHSYNLYIYGYTRCGHQIKPIIWGPYHCIDNTKIATKTHYVIVNTHIHTIYM